jgi:peptide/nickel transport system substrate-binding protein
MKSRLLPLLAILSCLLLPLLGCGGQSDDGATSDEALEPVRGGRIVIAIDAEPDALNPIIHTTSVAGAAMGIMNRGLATMNRQLEFQPSEICEYWTWSDDGLSLTYKLRDGVQWSDGAPFTTDDVLKTFELFMNPAVASPRAADFTNITDIEALDDLSIRFTFSERSRDQLFNSAKSLVAAHAVKGLDPAQISSWDYNRAPLSLGPYRLKEWIAGDRLILERNPYFIGEPAYLDEVVLKIVPDEASRLLQLEIGEVDMGQIPHKDIARIREKNPHVRLYEIAGRNTGYLMYNIHREMFADKRVRQAINVAIDRRALIDGLMYGYAEPIATFIPPLLGRAHDDGLEPFTRDPARARELLAEAGWVDTDGDGIVDKDGKPFSIELRTRTGDPVRENGALIIQRNLAEIGIEVTPRMMELSATLDRVSAGDFDIYFGKFGARLSVDPTSQFGTGGRFNHGGYSNPELDELIAKGVAELDPDRAVEIWHRVQEIVYEDQPWSFLYLEIPVVGIDDSFHDCTPHALSLYENIEQWWKEPEPGS